MKTKKTESLSKDATPAEIEAAIDAHCKRQGRPSALRFTMGVNRACMPCRYSHSMYLFAPLCASTCFLSFHHGLFWSHYHSFTPPGQIAF